MSDSSSADSLHVSVPDHEKGFASRCLPGEIVVPQPPSAQLAREHPDVRVLSVSSQDRVEPEVLTGFGRLEAVVTRSTGCDRLDLAELARRGIRAYHLDGYATESVAQHTLMFLFMLLRRAPEAMAVTGGCVPAAPGEPRWDRAGLEGRNLTDVTVGVLGTGRIGAHVARSLSALGARVVGFDIEPDPGLANIKGFRYASSLQELASCAHALTVHVPLTDRTRGMIDARTLAHLPDGAVLLNTARGPIVDQRAVAHALASKRLSGYAADVLPGEPDPPDLVRFRGSPRVVLTPHLAGYDTRALLARYEVTAQVVRWFLAREEASLRPHEANTVTGGRHGSRRAGHREENGFFPSDPR